MDLQKVHARNAWRKELHRVPTVTIINHTLSFLLRESKRGVAWLTRDVHVGTVGLLSVCCVR